MVDLISKLINKKNISIIEEIEINKSLLLKRESEYWKFIPYLQKKNKLSPENKELAKQLLLKKKLEKIKINEINAALRKNGIEKIFYKGGFLQKNSERISSDIDIYIDKKDIKKTIKILNYLGFKLNKKDYGIMGDLYEIELVNKDNIVIDLHWEFFYPYVIEINNKLAFTNVEEKTGIKTLNAELSTIINALQCIKDNNYMRHNLYEFNYAKDRINKKKLDEITNLTKTKVITKIFINEYNEISEEQYLWDVKLTIKQKVMLKTYQIVNKKGENNFFKKRISFFIAIENKIDYFKLVRLYAKRYIKKKFLHNDLKSIRCFF